MSVVNFDVTYVENRNRLTVFFRAVLQIPHALLVGVWGYANNLAGVIHWFIQVFTGKRNAGISTFSQNYLHYQARVSAYGGLLYDVYPNFGSERGQEPTMYQLDMTPDVNRVTVLFRIIVAIPAFIVAFLYGIGSLVCTILSWFSIVVTGKMPRGLFDFILKAQQYTARLGAYMALLTDVYPSVA